MRLRPPREGHRSSLAIQRLVSMRHLSKINHLALSRIWNNKVKLLNEKL
jgi:hypothetical protein